MKHTIAIDVGVNGALAVMKGDELVDLTDLPVVDGIISGSTLASIFADWSRCAVVVEKVHAQPHGSVANFSLGRNLGVILGVSGAMATPVVLIAPSHWKKTIRFTSKGKDQKNEAREIATRLYPDFADRFTRVHDHDRADSVLIGRAYSMLKTRGEL